MNDFIAIMLIPFLCCLVLTGIHAYLGAHIIKRGVIFVDLALAQVAALGATMAFLLGFQLHTRGSYIISLASTLFAALLLPWLRDCSNRKVPVEAYIGILYAVSAAATILILSRVPEGGEELHSLLVGHLLFVTAEELLLVAGVYAIIGFLHYLFRAPFFSLSGRYHSSLPLTRSDKFHDFLFYALFGVVVTSSVELAGVLVVFALLVVPAVAGALTGGNSLRMQLLISWGMGAVTSSLGIGLSYVFDLPTGPTIVVALGLTLLGFLIYSSTASSGSR